jgi:PKD repeat protein
MARVVAAVLAALCGIVALPLTATPAAAAAPVAVDDTASVRTGGSVDIYVVDNDVPDVEFPSITAWTTPTAGGTADCSEGWFCHYIPPSLPGTDTFTYTISDSSGGTDTATVTVTIEENLLPDAVDDVYTVDPDLPTHFMTVLANDTDPNAEDVLTITAFTPPTGGGTVDCAGQFWCVYTPPPTTGTETFTYTASDGNGASDTATVTVHVIENLPPVANDDTATVRVGQLVNIAVYENDTDPENEQPTIVDWTQPTGGGTVSCSTFDCVYTAPSSPETDTFTYTISDSAGGTDTATVTVTVVDNQPPVAVDDVATTGVGDTTTIFVLGNDTEPDGEVLRITGSTSPTGGGTVDCSSEFVCLYTAPAAPGIDTFTYTVGDGAGGSDTATVTVTVLENLPPSVSNDTAVVVVGETENIFVLSNDGDPDGDELSIIGATAPTGGGTVDCSSGTSCSYTAPASPGTDTFTYTVDDGHGNTDTAVVTVTVIENEPPDAVDDAFSVQPGSSARSLFVLSNDVDPNFDSLTITAASAPTGGGTVDCSAGTHCMYTAPAASGTDSFSYTVSDGHGGSDTATVTIRLDYMIIDNGTIQLGVNPEGHLNVTDGPASLGGTTAVGLRYLPTNAEATAPGCLCEGWGAADATSGVTGHANVAGGGVTNLRLIEFTSTPSTAHSVVEVGSTLRVTHDYHPTAATSDLYEVTVTVENISGAPVDPRYRRVMDWDVEPTAFSEFVTIEQGSAANLIYTDDGGFATADPLGPHDPRLFSGEAVDSGPSDHGALFDFDFDTLAPTESVTFQTYYGAAATETGALSALAAVGAEAYSLGQTSTPDGPTLGTPNTFVFGFTGIGGTPVLDPVADAGGPYATTEGAPVTLDGTASADPDGTITSYSWAPPALFADPTVATPVFTAPDDGTFTVTLTVCDDTSPTPRCVDDPASVVVGNVAPSVDAGADQSVDGLTVSLPPATYTDPGAADTHTATVDWGDGNPTSAAVDPATRTVSASHTYAAAGTYPGQVCVTDDDGGTGCDGFSATVTSVNNAPVAGDDAATTPEDTPVTVEVLTNDTDTDGDTLTVSGSGAGVNGLGLFACTGTTCLYTPGPDLFGTDSFTYTVSDGHGGTDTATVTVTITPVNDAPVAIDDSLTVAEGGSGPVDVVANDTDVDGDALTASGSGTTANGGVFSCLPTGCTYTAAAGFTGTDSFDYTVDDGNGGTDTGTVTVDVADGGNQPPVAEDDTATVAEASTVDIFVAGNDFDPDGDPLTVTVFTQPTAGGTVHCDGLSCTYTGTVGFTGTTTFTYTVTDPGGLSDTATVTITVVACPDLESAIDDGGIASGQQWIACSSVAANAVAGSPTPLITPQNGTLGILTSGSAALVPGPNNSSGAGVGNATSARGAFDVSVLRLDLVIPDGATCASFDFVFGSEEFPEFVGAFNDAFIAELDVSDWTVAGNDIVAPHNFAFDGAGNPVSVNSSFFDAGRVVTDNGMQYDGATPLLRAQTPVTPGAHTLYLSIFDANDHALDSGVLVDNLQAFAAPAGGCEAGANQAPDAVDDAASVAEDGSVDVDVLANDADPDGDTLAVVGVSDPANGTATVNTDGTIRYVPDADFHGTDSFTYTVSDGHGGTDTATVSVTVTPVNDLPNAVLSVTPVTGATPLPVSADGSGSSDVEGPLTYVWTFGDGGTASGPTAPHTYTSPGTYTVTLTVTDGDGATDTATQVVNVTGIKCQVDSFVLSTGDPSVDDGAVAIRVDGTGRFGTGRAGEPGARFNPPGTDPAASTVFSSDLYANFGGVVAPCGSAGVVEIVSVTPTRVITRWTTGGLTVELTQSVEPSAEGGSRLAQTYRIVNAGTAAMPLTLVRHVDGDLLFDGSLGDGGSARIDGSVLYELDSSEDPTAPSPFVAIGGDLDGRTAPDRWTVQPWEFLSDIAGAGGIPAALDGVMAGDPTGDRIVDDPYDVTLSQQWDGSVPAGGAAVFTALTEFGRQPANRPPVAENATVTLDEDTSAGFSLAAADPDADPVMFAVTGAPAHGSVSCDAAGACTYTPAPGFSGTDSYTFSASDGRAGGTATGTITLIVNPVNDPPVADDQAVTTDEDTAIGFTLSGSDIEGDTLTFGIVTPPAHGDVVCSGPALADCTYLPDADANGPDALVFSVSDGNGGIDTGTVTFDVVPVNDAPTASDQSVTTPEDTPMAITLTGSDVDGDDLGYSVVGAAAHGTVTCDADGACTYTPAADFNGSDSFTFTANDGGLTSDAATVSITVTPVNDDPVANPDAGTVRAGEAAVIAVLANDSDVDGDALAVTTVSDPARGSVTVNADGTVTYVADAGPPGTDTFTYTMTDGQGGTATATVTVEVTLANQPPVAIDRTVPPLRPGQTAVVTVEAVDPDSAGLAFAVSTPPTWGTLGPFTDVACEAVGDGSRCTAQVAYTASETDAVAAPAPLDGFGFSVSDGSASDTGAITVGAACTVVGTAGDDNLVGTNATNVICGLGGNDTIRGRGGNDVLLGGPGLDTVLATDASGAATVDLTAGTSAAPGIGADELDGFEHVIGGRFADTITGDASANRLEGGNGADAVNGGGGDDEVVGGAGNDELSGGGGADRLTGGGGADLLLGNEGDDELAGNDGNDTLNGGVDNDTLIGGAGQDVLSGADGDDALDGGTQIDQLFGGNGADSLAGGAAADVLSGGDGNDSIAGGDGNDTLDGGSGDDRLGGDAGSDVIDGGPGDDVFDGGDAPRNRPNQLDGGPGTDCAAAGRPDIRVDVEQVGSCPAPPG